MKRREIHHYSEVELLGHMLGDEVPEHCSAISSHLEECRECRTIFQEYQALLEDIHNLTDAEISETAWQEQKERLLTIINQDIKGSHKNIRVFLAGAISRARDYALEHPLHAWVCITVAVAFIFQEAVMMFRLKDIMPTIGKVIDILRQIL